MDENPQGTQSPIQTVQDENLANQDVVISDEEKSTLEDTTSSKIETLIHQKKWWREKAQKALQEVNELKAKVTPPPVAPPVSESIPVAQSAEVEAVARRVAMEMKRDELLAVFPEDKRGSVKEVFTALTAGKQLDNSNLNVYLEVAARAVGVEMAKMNSANRILSSSPGSIPPRTLPGPTPEQVALAQRLGNDPSKVYDPKLDLSHMANAEKFFGPKTEV